MRKDELGDVHAVLRVLDDRDAVPVVPHRDRALGRIDCDLDSRHRRVALLVVGRVHDDLIEDLVKARGLGDNGGRW